VVLTAIVLSAVALRPAQSSEPRTLMLAAFDLGRAGAEASPSIGAGNLVATGVSDFAWSSDGRQLAMTVIRPTPDGSTPVVVVRSVADGSSREVQPGLAAAGRPAWDVDGDTLAIEGIDAQGQRGIFRVDANSGDTTLIVAGGRSPQWTPDGLRLLSLRTDAAGRSTVDERDLELATDRPVYRGGRVDAMRLSPDGMWLALVDLDVASGASVLLVVPVGVGDILRLADAFRPAVLPASDIAWTPDSAHVLFRRMSPAGGDDGLWLASLGSGDLRPVAAEGPVHAPAIHPGGRSIAFLAP